METQAELLGQLCSQPEETEASSPARTNGTTKGRRESGSRPPVTALSTPLKSVPAPGPQQMLRALLASEPPALSRHRARALPRQAAEAEPGAAAKRHSRAPEAAAGPGSCRSPSLPASAAGEADP